MNERIRELAGQALDQSVPETWTTLTAYDLVKFSDKFAELMVKECAKICADTAVANPPNDLLEGYNMGVNKAAENIKEHFRVGE